jgi:pimeloyl-ACP methyl ester carboxylesterase
LEEIAKPNTDKLPVIAVSRSDSPERNQVEDLGLARSPHNSHLLRGLLDAAGIAILASLVNTVLVSSEGQEAVAGYFEQLRDNFLRSLVKAFGVVVGLGCIGAVAGFAIGKFDPLPKTTQLDAKELKLDLTKSNLIIFVHGWRGDSDGTWLKFPDLVRRDPRFSDTHVVAVNYPTFIARRNLTIGETASWIAEKLEENGVDHYSKIAIIAHSIGGLVSRKLVLQRRRGFRSVGVLVEIGTPHTGTERYAQLFDDLGIPIPGNDLVLEVKVGSDWLRELRNDWNALDPRLPTHCFTSPNDTLVPQDSALFQCDKFHYLPGFDHTGMVKPNDTGDDRYIGPTREIAAYLHPPAPVVIPARIASGQHKQQHQQRR